MGYGKKSFKGVMAIAAALACLLFFIGCKGKKPPPPPPKITVALPVKQKVTYYLDLAGNTQAVNTVQLVARVPGYLDRVFFHDGQMVKKGQPLFLIQQNTYQDALKQAEANVLALEALLEYARAQFTRYSNLLAENAAAQSDLDNWRFQRDSAQANLKSAIASRNQAKLNLSYTQVSAPFNGRIDRRLQDPGSLVGSETSNTTLAQMSQIDPIYVYFAFSDSDLARLMRSAHGIPGVSKKWPFSVGLLSEKGYPHQGHIDFASISISNTTGTLPMRGVLSNPGGIILPGLYARVRVPLETRDALLVPSISIGNDQQGPYVLLVNAQNIVERRNIKTGPLEGNLRVIEEGLAGDERVIVSALLKAHPGNLVTPELENRAPQGNR